VPKLRWVVRLFAFSLSIALLAGFASGLGSACKSASLDDAPDAQKECGAGAHVFCDPDATTGCTVGPTETDSRLKQLAQGVYAVGCTANYVSDEHDISGDCVVQAICRCNDPLDAGPDAAPEPPHWTCFP